MLFSVFLDFDCIIWPYFIGISGNANSWVGEESIGALLAFKNTARSSKGRTLGTASAPIHMVTGEGGGFKEQLWRTTRALGISFLLISAFGALIEDKGIGKGIDILNTVGSFALYFCLHCNGIRCIILPHSCLPCQGLVYKKKCNPVWNPVQSLMMSRELMRQNLSFKKLFSTFETQR